MKKSSQNFYIPERGNNLEVVSSYAHSASWPKEDACFNVTDFGYPVLHTHEYYEFLCILSGSISHTINGVQYTMHRGDCCLIRPTDCHCFELIANKDVPSIHINFMLRSSYFEKIAVLYTDGLISDISSHPTPLSFKLSIEEQAEIQQTCLSIQNTSDTPTLEEATICKALVNRLFGKYLQTYFSDSHSKYPTWLQSFILQLHSPMFFNSDIEKLMTSIPYSQSYVQHQFKHFTGTSIISYRNSVKMSTAKRLLSTTQMPVQEIAFYLGFDSVSHLNHLYKKQFGISPLTSRKQQKLQVSENES